MTLIPSLENKSILDIFWSEFNHSVIGLFNYINRFNNTFGALPQ